MSSDNQYDPKTPDATALKQHLFEAYGGFTDKRIKKIEKGNQFIIDDRDQHRDFDADKNLYYWFCLIFAKVISTSEVEVVMRGGVPMNGQIEAWIADGNAHIEEAPFRLIVPIKIGEEEQLRKLATIVELIICPNGPRYHEPSYKYVCPRVASSLRQFADVLSSFDS